MKWHLTHAVHGKKPWDVQAEAMRRAGGRDRYGYFLEQGLGKTALTLNDFIESDLIQCLALAPNSFKMDWALAPEEWGVGEDTLTAAWPSVYTAYQRKQNGYSRVLRAMNYEAARAGRGMEAAISFMDAAPTFLIIDESSAIKNPSSQTTKAVLRELVKRAAMVRELNGTPLVQNVMDYWPQLRALGELDGVNPYQFRNRFAVMGGYMGKQIVGMQRQEELYALLDRCSFRALKADWRDLPPKIYIPVHLEMTTKQVAHYRAMMEDFYTQVNGLDVTAELVLTQMNKLRQISSCLVMQEGKHEWLEPPERNPKVKAIFDILEGGEGKAIIPYFYRPSGEMLYDVLEKEKLQPAWIAGGMTPEATMNEKRRFNDDSNCRVILGQVSAISRGHTLLGKPGRDRCNKTIFYENSFERLHRAHVEDRNHRGEQDQDCLLYDLSTSPMDDIVINILQAKKNMADAVDQIVAVVKREKR